MAKKFFVYFFSPMSVSKSESPCCECLLSLRENVCFNLKPNLYLEPLQIGLRPIYAGLWIPYLYLKTLNIDELEYNSDLSKIKSEIILKLL